MIVIIMRMPITFDLNSGFKAGMGKYIFMFYIITFKTFFVNWSANVDRIIKLRRVSMQQR